MVVIIFQYFLYLFPTTIRKQALGYLGLIYQVLGAISSCQHIIASKQMDERML